jgi:DNA-binding transcriptional MerR regulator
LPKLLDVIKEKGLSHEDVINLLEDYNPEDSSDGEEEEEEIEEDIDDSEDEQDTENTDNEEIEPKSITISEDQLIEMINSAVEEKLKARRKPPSKGKKTKVPVPETKAVSKNMFEVLV